MCCAARAKEGNKQASLQVFSSWFTQTFLGTEDNAETNAFLFFLFYQTLAFYSTMTLIKLKICTIRIKYVLSTQNEVHYLSLIFNDKKPDKFLSLYHWFPLVMHHWFWRSLALSQCINFSLCSNFGTVSAPETYIYLFLPHLAYINYSTFPPQTEWGIKEHS